MSGHELDRWRAYDRLEPIPRPGWFEAQIAAAVVNANRTGGKPAQPEDFLPRRVTRRRRQTGEQMMAALKAATAGIQ